MPDDKRIQQTEAIIKALESLYLNLVGDPQSKKFWEDFWVFRDLFEGQCIIDAKKLRDSALRGLVRDIKVLQQTVEAGGAEATNQTELNLIAQIEVRDCVIAEKLRKIGEFDKQFDKMEAEIVQLRLELANA